MQPQMAGEGFATRNPGKEAITKKKAILHKSFSNRLARISTVSVTHSSGVRSSPLLVISFTAAASLRPFRCRAAGAVLGATRSRSSALRSLEQRRKNLVIDVFIPRQLNTGPRFTDQTFLFDDSVMVMRAQGCAAPGIRENACSLV